MQPEDRVRIQHLIDAATKASPTARIATAATWTTTSCYASG